MELDLSSFSEYGLLGVIITFLCYAVVWLQLSVKQITKEKDDMAEKLIEIVENNTKALTELSVHVSSCRRK